MTNSHKPSNITVLKFLPYPGQLFHDVAKLKNGFSKYVGRILSEGRFVINVTPEDPYVVRIDKGKDISAYVKACQKQGPEDVPSLIPADEATAKLCGVAFDISKFDPSK